ncbi:MAG: ParA family protein, partial [Candidatus Kariarchaeaceae archaeon]
AFHSYKGGSGKSLLSLNIASILANVHKKHVLVIEADFVMPSYQSVIQDLEPDIYFNDYLNHDNNDLTKYIYRHDQKNIDLIFVSSEFRTRDNVHGTDVEWFLSKTTQVKNGIQNLEYDFVIFDLSPGFHLFSISVLPIVSDIFLAMRPDYQSYFGLNSLVKKIYERAVLKSSLDCHLVFNQIPQYGPMADLLDTWQSHLELNYKFIEKYFRIDYESITSYHAAVQKMILPESDPTYRKLIELVPELYEL